VQIYTFYRKTGSYPRICCLKILIRRKKCWAKAYF